jgi:hypothetical protein
MCICSRHSGSYERCHTLMWHALTYVDAMPPFTLHAMPTCLSHRTLCLHTAPPADRRMGLARVRNSRVDEGPGAGGAMEANPPHDGGTPLP